MEFKIVYDQPGRLRLRADYKAFNQEQGFGIESTLLKIDGVESVESNHYCGSLLIVYSQGYKQVLALIEGLDRKNLPVGIMESKHEVATLNQDFFSNLSLLVARHYLFKLYVPSFIRTILVFRSAIKYWKDGLIALKNKELNVEVLDASAIGASIYLKDYASASSIMFLLNVAHLLEGYIKKKANVALADSLALNIENVWLFKDEQESFTPITKINIDDNVKIRMGSIVPLDGIVIEGEGLVNESSMTGESIGVLKNVGSKVYAGSVVEEGYIIIKVTSLAYNSRIQNIVAQIQESENARASLQSQAETLADKIVPFSFVSAFVIYGLTRNITKALSVLMVDFSCAIKLTTPISIVSATRDASNNQVIVKGGKYLESFAKADTIVFDKTGTLTTSQPIVSKILPFNQYQSEEILHIAACLEEHYPFSLAKTIVDYANEQEIDHSNEIHSEVEYIVAHGISSTINDEKVLIGSKHFVFEDEGVPLSVDLESYIEEETTGYSNIYLAIGNQLAGIICIEDPVRSEAKAIIQQLKDMGIKHTMILTGDEASVGAKIAKEVGIVDYQTRVSPEDKARIIKELKEQGRTIIMVGDGINDTLALTQADVSVAMSDGSELAKEVADITLKQDSLEGLVKLREISVQCFDRISLNYKGIVGFNSILLGLGVTGLCSNNTLSLLHNASTVLIGANSSRPYQVNK